MTSPKNSASTAASWRSRDSSLLHNVAVQSAVLQLLVFGAIIGAGYYLVGNAINALDKRGIATGFGFLNEEAGFGIGEALISFSPDDTYLRAILVGILNTLKVSAASAVAATVIGIVVGIARLSPNLGIAKLAGAYVELLRNTPQLLQIIMWYWIITRLPGARQALEPLPGLLISNRGVQMAWPADHSAWGWSLLAVCLAAVAVFGWSTHANRQQAATGRRPPVGGPAVALLVGLPLATWWIGGAPTAIEWPVLRGLNFAGGLNLSPEFVALFLGLSLYISAFVAEIVRGGLQAVAKGQVEAAQALGLKRGQLFRLVLLPQALRVMVPPLAAQYVSLVKNSSLAVAIGYPDLVNVSNTTLNQTGHVIEAITIMSLVYLAISLLISAAMNAYNRMIMIQER